MDLINHLLRPLPLQPVQDCHSDLKLTTASHPSLEPQGTAHWSHPQHEMHPPSYSHVYQGLQLVECLSPQEHKFR